jgi:hypothetical protein
VLMPGRPRARSSTNRRWRKSSLVVPIAGCTVDAGHQPLDRFHRGQIDDRARRGGDGGAVDDCAVEAVHRPRRVHHMTDAIHGASRGTATWNGSRSSYPSNRCSGGSRAARPARRGDRGDQPVKGEHLSGVREGAVGPTADAAQVSTSKLRVRRSGVTALTICCRPWAAGAGHAPSELPDRQIANSDAFWSEPEADVSFWR